MRALYGIFRYSNTCMMPKGQTYSGRCRPYKPTLLTIPSSSTLIRCRPYNTNNAKLFQSVKWHELPSDWEFGSVSTSIIRICLILRAARAGVIWLSPADRGIQGANVTAQSQNLQNCVCADVCTHLEKKTRLRHFSEGLAANNELGTVRQCFVAVVCDS